MKILKDVGDIKFTQKDVYGTEMKVSENHKMIKPLWENFIRRNTNGHVERLDEQTDFKVRFKWK